MKYKTVKNKRSGKWYPQSVNSGKVSTRELSDEIAEISTISHADVKGTLEALSRVMRPHLIKGETVTLDGIGSFYLTAQAQGNGVAEEEDVSPAQINKVMVRFRAAKEQSVGGIKQSIPTLAAGNIMWQRVTKKPATGTSGGGTTPTPGVGDGDEG